jgi:hypothetical protein
MMIAAAFRSLLALILVGGALSFDSATPTATSGQTDTREEWWSSWSGCVATPIHTEIRKASNAMDKGLEHIPWIQPSATGAGVVGHLFYGNRPVHTGGKFPDGEIAKVLWQTDQPVRDLTLAAKLIETSAQPPVILDAGGVYTGSAYATQFPSNISVPILGCWEVDLDATTQSGEHLHATAVLIVVE